MFLVRWLRRLFSLPFIWLGQLAAMLKLPSAASLFKTAWWIGGDGKVGVRALGVLVRQHGPAATLPLAKAWLERQPRAEVGAFAGLLALDCKDVECATSCLACAKALGENSGMADYLEVLLASRGSSDVLIEVTRRFESRRDLPSDASKMVLHELLWQAMLQGKFDEARKRARHVLEVAESPSAEAALWALAKRERNPAEIRRHLDRIQGKAPMKLYYKFLGNLAIGADGEARELLAQLKETDEAAARLAETVLRERGAGI